MIGLVIALLRIYTILIIIRAVVSWVPMNPNSPVIQLLLSVTEPVLKPIRRYTLFGGVDLSPVVVIILIYLIIGILS